jgi:hypothetical protein
VPVARKHAGRSANNNLFFKDASLLFLEIEKKESHIFTLIVYSYFTAEHRQHPNSLPAFAANHQYLKRPVLYWT